MMLSIVPKPAPSPTMPQHLPMPHLSRPPGCRSPYTASPDNTKVTALTTTPTASPSSVAYASPPPSLINTKCSCGKDLDPFGDHVFSCPNAHKGQLSHAIRDTFAHLLRTLAPLAAFTDSTESVTTETPCLAPNDLRKRPADVGMHLLPTYLRTQSPHHARFLAVDVTIPAPPPSSDASTTAATATTQHHQAERAKFSVTGNRSYVRVFEDLVNQQILLLHH
jgi:hypothetical protein